jgi:cobalt/nickel transport system ATP-binding protein
MSAPAVQVSHVTYAYPDGQTALRDVSFQIEQGESIAVIGGNGAGKSTLLLHLNGFLTPQSGSVHIGELPVTRETLMAVRRSVGMVFQNPDHQLFMATVYDDVAFGPTNMKLPSAEIEQRVGAALATVGCAHLATRPPHRLSGGEKRSVAIAGILAMSPSVLVLDEPSDGLDPAARRNLIHLLCDFTHTRLIATHDLDLVLDVCSRVLVLRQGEVQADGPPEVVFNNIELLQRCRLEQPLGWQSRTL